MLAGVKDAIVYSSLAGAKKCAKQLNHILDAAGVDYPLAKCQAAVAKAGGYRGWHDLNSRISVRSDTKLPYDYWGRLLDGLPEPCRVPIAWHLNAEALRQRDASSGGEWLRAVLPYAVGLEVIHRSHSPILQLGTGRGQKLRLAIVSSILLNMGGGDDFSLRLDPESLNVTAPGEPHQLLPRLTAKSGFDAALGAVIAAGILEVGTGITRVVAPTEIALRSEILERVRKWNIQKMPKIDFVEVDPKLWSAVQRQYDIDRAGAGPKAPYEDIDYRGIRLSSRFSVLSEFETMQRVVDAMSDSTRLRVASVWCDSLAGADYQVEIKLGMFRDGLPEDLRDHFLAVTHGFNGLSVNHGSKSKSFYGIWPAEDAYYASIDFPEADDLTLEVD